MRNKERKLTQIACSLPPFAEISPYAREASSFRPGKDSAMAVSQGAALAICHASAAVGGAAGFAHSRFAG